MRELIVGIVLGIGAVIIALANRKYRIEADRKKREQTFKEEIQRTERLIREKSLPDNIDRLNKLLNDESKNNNNNNKP